MVRKEALAHANGGLTETEISTIFTVATTPAQQSFASQAETELMQIATGQSTETLEQYRQRYFWIRNNFSSSRILSLSQLDAEIAALKARGGDLSHQVAKRLAAPRLVRQQKLQLFTRGTLRLARPAQAGDIFQHPYELHAAGGDRRTPRLHPRSSQMGDRI
jgi:hypothetical protein